MKKINIIKKDKEISNIIKTGKYKKNNYYVVYKKNNDSNKYYRFCVCVSKKIGNAVVRNKNKRQIKDIIDKSKIKFSRTSDYVIIIKKEINSLNYEEKKNNLIDLLLKLEGEIMTSKRLRKVLIIILLVITLTGCTKVLKDKKTNKVVYYENDKVKITLNENILCKPEDKGLVKKYNKYKKQVNIDKLPKCSDFKVNDSKYEGLWENLFVKPLAFLIIRLKKLVKNYGLSIIILGLLIRLVLAPFTQKTAMQSENMKAIQPEIDKINKKYENKNDQESMNKKSMEIMQLYKKNNINPFSSCLFAFIQIPLLMAFYEAINRVPVIFEGNLLGLVLGTTPMKAVTTGHYEYLLIVILIIITTIISQKLNKTAATPQTNDINPNMMMNMMVIMIAIMSLNFSVALSLYWISSTIFTIVQNLIAKNIKKRGAK